MQVSPRLRDGEGDLSARLTFSPIRDTTWERLRRPNCFLPGHSRDCFFVFCLTKKTFVSIWSSPKSLDPVYGAHLRFTPLNSRTSNMDSFEERVTGDGKSERDVHMLQSPAM